MNFRPTAFILSFVLLALAAAPAGAASFHPQATVDGDDVALSDLFDDAGPAAAQIVARAPAPGRRMVFDAHALSALAQAYGVDWRSSNPHDRAVVERSSIVIGGDRIESLVSGALAEKGVPQPFAVLFDRRNNRLALPVGTGALTVESMTYDPDQKRFSGMLTAAAPTGAIDIPVSGLTAAIVEIPVLNRALNEGEVVGVADLDMVPMQSDRIARDTLVKSEDLVGRTAEHTLSPRRALRVHDFKRDLVVKRGQTVTLALDDPNMSLTIQARALTDGAKGEPVKVLNLSSSRVVEGVAAGPDFVTVAASAQSVSTVTP